jgi:hypothetical protein
MKIDMKSTLFILCMALFIGGQSCSSTAENLVTKTYEQDNKKFIVQQLPANFNDGAKGMEMGLKYYRLIIETPVKLSGGSDVNYINFGMENFVRLVKGTDSVAPVFMQRIANGKETMYEYIVAFEGGTPVKSGYEICMNDQVFGLGNVSVKF